MQPCKSCGIVFDFDNVPSNPFKLCPNPACKAPLDADAVEHRFYEAGNPSDPRDTQRAAAKAQVSADLAQVSGDTRSRATKESDANKAAQDEADAKAAQVKADAKAKADAAAAVQPAPAL